MKISERYYFMKFSAESWFKDIEKFISVLIGICDCISHYFFAWCDLLTDSEGSGLSNGWTVWVLVPSWLWFHMWNQFLEHFWKSPLSSRSRALQTPWHN